MGNNIVKYHHAAFSYVCLGVVIVLTTGIFVPSDHYRSGILPLLGGIALLLVLSYFLYKGVSWLGKVLCVLAGGRTIWWLYSFVAFGDEVSSWVYIVNALLNGMILFMIARAVWDISFKSDPLNTNSATS